MNIFPYRVRFAKGGRLRFLSHHELMRLFERALRRSGLPLRMTEGFNPHPILAFPVALATGIESRDEVMELELSSWVAPARIRERMAAQMPEGIQILAAEAFHRSRREQVDFVEYEATLPSAPPDLAERIRAFLERAECWVERRRGPVVEPSGTEAAEGPGTEAPSAKPVEVRRYVMALECEGAVVMMRIRNTDEGTARPDELLRALGLEPLGPIRVVKTFTALRPRP
jgi:hypothetical protein